MRLFSFAFAVALLGCCLPAFGAEPDWRAGAARVNITPEKLMWMAGYGSRNKPAEGKLTDLWAKALVLQDSHGHRAVLISLDLVGIGRDLSQAVCQALHERHGFERRQIAICTSHTHTGPVVARNLSPLHYLLVDPRQQELINEYAKVLHEKIVAVVGQALEQLTPSRLSWGHATATFAVNRRNNREADVPQLRSAGQLQGPFDHDVPVLAVHDDSGQLTSVVFGYACHATVLSFYQWSGDWPGFAQSEIENNHPGCVALFFAGCGADQNPLPRRTVEMARRYGGQAAAAVDEALTKLTPVAGTLQTSYREIDLPLDTLPDRQQIEKDAQAGNKYVVARARMLLDQLDAGQPLSPTYPYPVGVWKLGHEIQFVVLGGEVVVDYAVRLKAELGGVKTWVAGYANDVMAYIPSRRVLAEGGYEGGGAMVYYGLPTVWTPDVENLIVQEVHAQIGQQE